MTTKNAGTKAYQTTGASNQKQFLQSHLRGTNVWITVKEANDVYDIKKLNTRLFEMKQAGLRVTTKPTGHHTELAYKVSARDLTGSRAMLAF